MCFDLTHLQLAANISTATGPCLLTFSLEDQITSAAPAQGIHSSICRWVPAFHGLPPKGSDPAPKFLVGIGIGSPSLGHHSRKKREVEAFMKGTLEKGSSSKR